MWLKKFWKETQEIVQTFASGKGRIGGWGLLDLFLLILFHAAWTFYNLHEFVFEFELVIKINLNYDLSQIVYRVMWF